MRVASNVSLATFERCISSQGTYQEKPRLPFVPGSEVSGVVTEVADDVHSVKVRPGNDYRRQPSWHINLLRETTILSVSVPSRCWKHLNAATDVEQCRTSSAPCRQHCSIRCRLLCPCNLGSAKRPHEWVRLARSTKGCALSPGRRWATASRRCCGRAAGSPSTWSRSQATSSDCPVRREPTSAGGCNAGHAYARC